MPDIIKLLPDSVANQIAAGEVIQRPASAVKELMENAVDAGATEIKVAVKDAGKTLVQIIDNGCGMSETDARLAFERHATSKITCADDLFSISTKGFRGEALASIAAVAMVELKTARCGDTQGTFIRIAGSTVESQESCSHTTGTVISVKNLFYNVPARRKFLKADSTEFRHIINEFQKIALSHPEIKLQLFHNDAEQYNLPAANFKQRIVNLFGRAVEPNLVSLTAETSLVTLSGFIGKPEHARKTAGEQFFLVNNRYMRHSYFHKAVTEAYSNILSPGMIPSYFISITTDPASIDVNIHPTKTEIKFEDEKAIWQIIHASVRESLGRFNISPSIDFQGRGFNIDIPVMSRSSSMPDPPAIKTDSSFNPFRNEEYPRNPTTDEKISARRWDKHAESLFFGDESQQESRREEFDISRNFFNVKNRYIMTPVKSGVMIIDQKRAHERILFEELLQTLGSPEKPAQKTIFPVTVELSAGDMSLIDEIIDDLNTTGFEVSVLAPGTLSLTAHPGGVDPQTIPELIDTLIAEYRKSLNNPSANQKEKLATALARASAIPYGRHLSATEMEELFDRLFACKTPNYSPTGKKVIVIMPVEDIEKRFR
jgi:DNA mismatch repair protein MutL